jgi:integrase
MASIWKHPQSQFWTACFTDRAGRRLKRSTKTTDRRQALKLAEQYEEAARKKRTARQVRQVIQDLHQNIVGEDLKTPSVREYVATWTDQKSALVGAATLAFYRKAGSKFVSFLGDRADAPIEDITREQVQDFRNNNAKKVAARTVNHDLKCLRMIFKAARRDGLIAEDPAEFVETVRAAKSISRRAFSMDELHAVLRVADDEWRSMVLFGLYTGQRLADVATLCWEQVNLIQATISVIARKTGRHSLIPIAPPLKKHIEAQSRNGHPKGPLHPRASAIVGEHGRTGILSSQFAGVLVSAGLREAASHKAEHDGRAGRRGGGLLSYHCLRHTAVTFLKEAGVPAAVVMELVGHDSEQMSQHYTHVGHDALAKAAKTLPDLFADKKNN